MATRRRRRQNRLYTGLIVVILAGGAGAYYKVFWKPVRDAAEGAASRGGQTSGAPGLTSQRPEHDDLTGGPYNHVPERGADATSSARGRPEEFDTSRARALMQAGFASNQRGEIIDARAKLSEALALQLPQEETVRSRAALSKLVDQTLFSTTIAPNDPFVSAYVIQPGETLVKIAKRFDVTADLLARVNNISDKNRIRAGQRIKVLRGPFHAVIDRETFDMDVYLQKTFIKHFKVGLGANGSTPSGKWKVRSKLVNPTYYPPRGGDIIAADDPENPLAERWIGLEGVEGDAVGQERYGIHGTVEPESIGKNTSLGCVRLYNEDVGFLFDLLVPEKSVVVIR